MATKKKQTSKNLKQAGAKAVFEAAPTKTKAVGDSQREKSL